MVYNVRFKLNEERIYRIPQTEYIVL